MNRYTKLHLCNQHLRVQEHNLTGLYIDLDLAAELANDYAHKIDDCRRYWNYYPFSSPLMMGTHDLYDLLVNRQFERAETITSLLVNLNIRTSWRHNTREKYINQLNNGWRYTDRFEGSTHLERVTKRNEFKQMGAANAAMRKAKTLPEKYKLMESIFPLAEKHGTRLRLRYAFFTIPRKLVSVDTMNLRNILDRLQTWRSSSVPWGHEDWWMASPCSMLHAPRSSKKHEGLLAYFQNADKIERDILTPIKAGRYLQQFFPNLGAEQIKFWATRFNLANAKRKVYFTDTTTPENHKQVEKQWLHIYATGPASCMRGKRAPRVYAYPNNHLRLAFFTSDNLPMDYENPTNTPVSRCIVRDDDMEWVRIYPEDEGTLWNGMKESLTELGYERGNLNGIRGQWIEDNGGVVCPYVDCGNNGHQSISTHHTSSGRYIEFGGGEYDACNTDGFADTGGETCCSCDERVHEDDAYHNDDGETYCSECWHDNHTEAYGRRGRLNYTHNDNVIEVDGNYYHVDYLDDNNIIYLECGDDRHEYCHMDNAVLTPDGWCRDSDAVHIDVPTRDGCDYVVSGDEVTTYDGRTIYESDAVTIVRDGVECVLHDGDDPDDYLPEEKDDDDEETDSWPFPPVQHNEMNEGEQA